MEDHFSKSDVEMLIKKWSKKEPRPEPMTEAEKLRAKFRQNILNRKKRTI
jgi:hypothetical protein